MSKVLNPYCKHENLEIICETTLTSDKRAYIVKCTACLRIMIREYDSK